MIKNGFNNSKYKISVLVTFYNQEKYVDDALRSVFSQDTDFEYKIIVGDDGSSDNTLLFVKQWREKYPDCLSYIVQPRENDKKYIAGSRASRNRLALLEQVDTPYFIFLDGDDYWIDNHKLQIQYDILEREENRDCVACGHQVNAFDENCPKDIVYFPPRRMKEKKFSLKKYWASEYIHTDSILFRSENIKKLPLGLIADSFNDNLITFCFMQYGKLYYLPQNMATYRQNEQGIWIGEKRTISVVRELMLYDLEQQINPTMKGVAMCRHWGNFLYVIMHRCEFEKVDKEYLLLTQKYNCKTTQQVLNRGCAFSTNIIAEAGVIFVIAIRKIIVKLRQLINRK